MGSRCGFLVIIVVILIRIAVSQTVTTRSYKVLEGDNLLVVCNVTNSSETVFWSKSYSSFRQDGKRLEILNIKRTDDGEYTCHEIQQSPDVNGTDVNVTVEIIDVDVQYPAEIDNFNLTQYELLENDTFTIRCEMLANPNPTWEIRNRDTGKVVWVADYEAHAVIGPISASYEDMGYWECTGGNTLNNGINVTRGHNLTVNCPPRPMENNNYTATALVLGQSVELIMDVKATYPIPSFTWSRKSGKGLPSRENQTDTDYKSILRVENVTISDFGDYYLTVKNNVGTFSATYFLLPDGPPVRPKNLQYSNVTHNSVTLYWTSGYDMGTQQYFYVVKLFNGNAFASISEWIYDNSTNHGVNKNWTYVLTGLDSNTFYNLSVVAENESPQSKHYWSGYAWPPVAFVTKEAPPTPNDSKSSSSSDVALIVGITLGSLGALGTLAFLVYIIYHRHRRTSYASIDGKSGKSGKSGKI